MHTISISRLHAYSQIALDALDIYLRLNQLFWRDDNELFGVYQLVLTKYIKARIS